MAKKSTLTSLCLLALLVTQPMAHAQSESSDGATLEGVEQEMLSTSERLKLLDVEIQKSRALKSELDKALAKSNNQVQERNKRIKGLDGDIEKYNTQLSKLEAQVKLEQANIEQRKQVLATSIRRAQSVTSGQGLKVVLQNDNPALADRLSVYTSYYMEAQSRAINEQQAALEQIADAHLEALKNRNWLNHIKKKASAQQASYKATSDQNRQSIEEVNNEITSKTRTVAQLKLDQTRLQTLMEELRAAQVAKSGYFLSGQGDYSLPVQGTIQAYFGDVKSVGKLRWNGLFIAANHGSRVRAIADGAVVYSDWLNGFGMLVILDHGDGYMTLYGGNREVAVKPEDWVESGSTIATVGDSGGQKSSGLYFEVRHNAKPVDPTDWVNSNNKFQSAQK